VLEYTLKAPDPQYTMNSPTNVILAIVSGQPAVPMRLYDGAIELNFPSVAYPNQAARAASVTGSTTPTLYAVGYGVYAFGVTHWGIRWFYDAASSAYEPVILLPAFGFQDAVAVDVNNNGIATGNSGVTPDFAGQHATCWFVEPTGYIYGSDLGLLPGATTSTAAAISNANIVVGTSGNRAFTCPVEPASQSAGTMTPLPPLSGDDSTSAIGITDSGEVVGVSTLSQNASESAAHGVIWRNGTPTALSDLVPEGWTIEEPVAVNAAGQIVAKAKVRSSTTYVVLTPKS